MGINLLCHGCLGDGCAVCGYRGKIIVKGLVKSLLTEIDNDLLPLWSAYKILKEYSVFPCAGGWLDQTSKFIHCVKWCDIVNLKMANSAGKESNDKAELLKKSGMKIKGK